jgi:hypothetical protein
MLADLVTATLFPHSGLSWRDMATGTRFPHAELVWGLIPVVLPFISSFLDFIGKGAQRSHRQQTKDALELLKIKYEIEALRQKEQLDMPRITISEEELRLATTPAHETEAWGRMRLRKTFTYRFVQLHPRLGSAVTYLVMAVAAIYTLMILIGIPLTYQLPDVRQGPNLLSWTIWAGAYLFVGFVLVLWALRIFSARGLALTDPPVTVLSETKSKRAAA